jgi:hypothetical protein
MASKVLYSPDGEIPSDFPNTPAARATVVKIVIGSLPDDEEKRSQPAATRDAIQEWLNLSALGTDFENLTHLHLWRLHGLKRLSGLPKGLKCLDVRHAPDLEAVEDLPSEALDTLVLGDCAGLATISPLVGNLPLLTDLNLRECPGLPQRTIQSFLDRSPSLQTFDASGCLRLKLISGWPESLYDIRLGGCEALEAVPEWPNELRRLQLRDTAIPTLRNFPATLDYIDLGGMRKLEKLPAIWGNPGTLFLFGSGLLMPPASEHGERVDENVSNRTRAFFDDVDLTGKGSVKRCKLLVLGNGGAGKTCFALNLVGDDPDRTTKDYQPEEKRLGTTHGVQFFDWTLPVSIQGSPETVHVHLWDFGGQEIYHNTHRMFMGAGTVFVVLWNPEQFNCDPEQDASGHQDNWRPLSYWIDYIKLACPHEPRIAIVVSGQTKESDEILEKLRADAGGDEALAGCKVVYIDSLKQTGQMDSFVEDWLIPIVGHVVTTQGTAVPSYWEIAQGMVQDWVSRFPEEPLFAAGHQRLDAAVFGQNLEDEIKRQVLAGDPKACRFPLLRDAVLDAAAKREPFMTEDRIRRTLAFLTHSGWIYWHPDLTGGKAIVGQKWALDGIYTILERVDGKEQSSVYLHLKERKGRFTMHDLERWGWSRDIPDEADRELLISFMERIGLCVRLVKREDLISGEPQYLSLSHLPPRQDAGVEAKWKARLKATPSDLADVQFGENQQTVENTRMHQGHWDQILRSLGDQFGTDGEYARDGFFATTRNGQAILIVADLNDRGLGGTITVDVVGPEAAEVEKQVADTISAFVKGEIARIKVDGDVGKVAGEPPLLRIFLSYTRNPKDDAGETPVDHEGPVKTVYRFLEGFGSLLKVYWDAEFDFDAPHAFVTNFMADGIRKSSRILLFDSKKYWESKYCVWEFVAMLESMEESHDNLKESFLVVQVADSPTGDGDLKRQLEKVWETRETDPKFKIRSWMADLDPPVTNRRDMVEISKRAFRRLGRLSDPKVPNLDSRGKTDDELTAWVAQKLGLNPPTPRFDDDLSK